MVNPHMTITALEPLTAIRAHADRVHDAVRRLGCNPAAALEVVTESAVDLMEVAARELATTGDLVGWWFGRARSLGRSAADGEPDLPLGGGLLAVDEDQTVLAEVLEELSERDRVALLMRDSYALSEESVGAALGAAGEGAAMELVARARLAFVQALDGDAPPSLAGHRSGGERPGLDLAGLARLAEGGPISPADLGTQRHLQSCATCQVLITAMERAHQLLAGLTVAALPDSERAVLLARLQAGAAPALDNPGPLPDEQDDEPRRLLTPVVALLLLCLALLGGLGLGVLLSRGDSAGQRSVVDQSSDLQLPAAPVNIVVVSPPPSPVPLPSPSAFMVPPSPSANAQASSSPVASAGPTSTDPSTASALTLTLDQSSGPNGAPITVRGTGWPAAQSVQLQYLDQFGRQLGAAVTASTTANGSFTATIRATDQTGLPGPHRVRAISGTTTATATYNAT